MMRSTTYIFRSHKYSLWLLNIKLRSLLRGRFFAEYLCAGSNRRGTPGEVLLVRARRLDAESNVFDLDFALERAALKGPSCLC